MVSALCRLQAKQTETSRGRAKYPSLTRLMREKAEWDKGIDFHLLQ